MDLIDLSDKCKGFEQIAVDILHRQGKLNKIAEHRLTQGRPVDAIRCLKDQQIELPLCVSILEAAWATDSRQTKYTVYTILKDVRKLSFFETHGEFFIQSFINKDTEVKCGHLVDQLERYTREFKQLFNEEELQEAERRFRLAAIGGSSTSISGMNSSRRDSLDLDESHECSSLHSEEPLDMNVIPGAGLLS
jgi:hypothetical protein